MANFNHGTEWTTEQEFTLVDAVIMQVEKGGTQRDAFKSVASIVGRTPGAVEYHWKKIRKEDPGIMEKFEKAVADALVESINYPDNSQVNPQDIQDEVVREITKGAVHVHRMIEQVINPGQGITLPADVAHEVSSILETYPQLFCFNLPWLRENEYDSILDFIEKPSNLRRYFQAVEKGFDIEQQADQKIRIIYDALKTIKPNQPGYMTARGMIVMMWHMMGILGIDGETTLGITRDMPF